MNRPVRNRHAGVVPRRMGRGSAAQRAWQHATVGVVDGLRASAVVLQFVVLCTAVGVLVSLATLAAMALLVQAVYPGLDAPWWPRW